MVPTPGDFLPDLYVLWQPATNRFYSFVPHNGLCRHDSIAEAPIDVIRTLATGKGKS